VLSTTAPNQLWQTDFTFLKVISWVYLSTIIAWKLSTTMKAEDATETLELALKASAANAPRSPIGHGDDVENLSHIWAVAPALVKLALRDDRRSQIDKEPPWKRIAKGLI